MRVFFFACESPDLAQAGRASQDSAEGAHHAEGFAQVVSTERALVK